VISSTPARGACSLAEPLDTLRLTDAMLGILRITLKIKKKITILHGIKKYLTELG
jgi:hypothetical protein